VELRPWLQALKYTPLPHLASFVFGVLLANVDELVERQAVFASCGSGRLWRLFCILTLAPVLRTRCFTMAADAAVRLHRAGLAGRIRWRSFSGCARCVCGRGQLLPLPVALQPVEHDSRLACAGMSGLIRFDPWISYGLLIVLALLALHLVEKPAQRQLRKWMGA